MLNPLRIATRSSPLALWQANYVKDELHKAHPGLEVELVHVTTGGDRNTLDPLHTFGGMGVFTKEVQLAVLEGRADLAVHSLKDLPTEPTQGLTIACIPPRAFPYDVIVYPSSRTDVTAAKTRVESKSLKQEILDEQQWVDLLHTHLAFLPPGANVGTGSLRRRAQLTHLRPDLTMGELRGNLDTRLAKLETGEFDAIVLAFAGLDRLQRQVNALPLMPPLFFPAVGQGALGLETRHDDHLARDLLLPLNDTFSFRTATAERAVLRTLQAGCHAPVGCVSGGGTSLDGEVDQSLEAVVLSIDGRKRVHARRSIHNQTLTLSQCEQLGIDLARDLMAQGAADLLGSTHKKD